MDKLQDGMKRIRYELSNPNNQWVPGEMSTGHDKTRITMSESKVATIIQCRGIANSYTLPADMGTLKMFAEGQSILVYSFGKAVLNGLGYTLQLQTDGSRAFSGTKVMKPVKPKKLPGVDFPDNYRVLQPIKITSDEGCMLSFNQEVVLASIFLACKKKSFRDNSDGDNFQGLGIDESHMREVLGGYYAAKARELIDTANTSMVMISKATKKDKEGDFVDEELMEELGGEDLLRLAQEYKELRKKFLDIWYDFNLVNTKNQAISNILAEDIISHESDLIDVDGRGYASRYLPKKEWFKQEIQDTVTLEILSVFPEAEREVFAMFLGRTVAGREGQRYTSGKTQQIGWRGMPVLIDSKGGMGKSKFTGILVKTLGMLGYSYGSFPPSMSGNFGFGDAARSDLFNIDDASDDTLPGIIQSAVLKSLISNSDNISVHDKGQKHTIVKYPRCAGFVISNSFPLHKMNLDGGMISRILPMKLWTDEDQAATEFTEKFGIRFPMNDALSDMANKLNTTVEVLLMYILRLAYDKWASYSNTDEMVEDLKQHLSQFRLNLKTDHHKELMKKYLLVKKRTDGVPKSFDAGDFLRTILFMQNNYWDEPLKQYYPWSQTIPQCQTNPIQITTTLQNLASTKISTKRLFADFMDSLTSLSGSNYNKYINHWSNLFFDCLSQVNNLSDPLDRHMFENPTLRANMIERSKASCIELGFTMPDVVEFIFERNASGVLKTSKEQTAHFHTLLPGF